MEKIDAFQLDGRERDALETPTGHWHMSGCHFRGYHLLLDPEMVMSGTALSLRAIVPAVVIMVAAVVCTLGCTDRSEVPAP